MANLIGIVILAAMTMGVAWLVPDKHVSRSSWLLIFAALAAFSIFCWSHRQAPKAPGEWLFLAGISIPFAIVLSLVDGAVALMLNPSFTFLEALMSNAMAGFIFAISPFGTFVAIAGWVRSLILQRARRDS